MFLICYFLFTIEIVYANYSDRALLLKEKVTQLNLSEKISSVNQMKIFIMQAIYINSFVMSREKFSRYDAGKLLLLENNRSKTNKIFLGVGNFVSPDIEQNNSRIFIRVTMHSCIPQFIRNI